MSIEVIGSQSFDELSKDFSQAEDWLESLGVPTTNSRISAYRSFIDMLVQLYRDENYEEINRELSSHLNALYEANEIIFIHKSLGEGASFAIADVLKEIISGPDSYCEESKNNNRARNFAFELLLAGRFSAGGFEVVVDCEGSTDVVARKRGLTILSECKRPASNYSAKKNISKAIKQIRRKIGGVHKSTTKGIVALDATKIINGGFKLLVGSNETDLNLRLSGCVHNYISENKDEWLALRKKGVLGVVVRFSCMAINKKDNMYTYCQFYSALPFSEKGGHDYTVLSEMVGDLKV